MPSVDIFEAGPFPVLLLLVVFLALTAALVAYLFLRSGPAAPAASESDRGLLSKEQVRAVFAMPLDTWQAHVASRAAAEGAWRGTTSALGDTLMERSDGQTVQAIRPVYERSTDRPDALVVVLVSRPKPEGVDGEVAAEAIRYTTNIMLPQYIVTGTHEEREDQISVELMITEDR